MDTYGLQVGDIVLCAHGLRVELNQEPRVSTGNNAREVRSFTADALNADEAIGNGFPADFLAEGTWVIQGNDLATWTIERRA